ncbi:MAG: hypothetical protein ACFCU4_01740 [Puniceicoccaceae bacterium]
MAVHETREIREAAWIGDAVLALIIREQILKSGHTFESGADRLQQELTSNKFLNRFGRPSAIEAEIGMAYTSGGVTAARDWIEQHLGNHIRKIIRPERI